MVNILELELKLESKDQLLDVFGKTNPPVKKPCMSSCVFYFDGSVLLSISILSLAFCCFHVTPFGLVLFQMDGKLNGRMMMRSDILGWPLICIPRLV